MIKTGDIVIAHLSPSSIYYSDFHGKKCVFMNITKGGLYHVYLLWNKRKTASLPKRSIIIPHDGKTGLNREPDKIGNYILSLEGGYSSNQMTAYFDGEKWILNDTSKFVLQCIPDAWDRFKYRLEN